MPRLGYEISKHPNREYDEIRVKKRDGFFGVTLPITVFVGGGPSAASDFSTPFFVAQRTYIVMEIRERHESAGTSNPTLQVEKVPDGTAPGSGTNLITTAFDLTSTANTLVTGTLVSDPESLRLVRGDSLSLKESGTLTNVDGVTVTVVLKAI